MIKKHLCRHCGSKLEYNFLDLGFAPPSNAYLNKQDLESSEKYYPLRIKVCDSCFLVQTEDYVGESEFFNDEYAYFSSTSAGFLEHASKYSNTMIEKLDLDESSFVIEIASNDGYLLKNFVAKSIPCLGIEPTKSTAMSARKLKIPTLIRFFDELLAIELAKDGKNADLIIGNNVLAHVPNINDFVQGLKTVLKEGGVITLEFPHLLNLIKDTQFDTVYHEHFSYLSLYTVIKIFKLKGLKIYNVEKLSTHGGSIRIYACHQTDSRLINETVDCLLKEENDNGLLNMNTYLLFQQKTEKIKNNFIEFLVKLKNEGKTIAAYGAAAKGNTLINFCGLKTDLIEFVVDAAPAKQGKFLPGSHIPIYRPEVLLKIKPDYLLILPWNICNEVKQQNIELERFGTRFVVVTPKIRII
jgi:SAM-dependent methyltransferase